MGATNKLVKTSENSAITVEKTFPKVFSYSCEGKLVQCFSLLCLLCGKNPLEGDQKLLHVRANLK